MEIKDLSFAELSKYYKHVKEQSEKHTDILKKGKFSMLVTMCEKEAERRELIK